MGYVLTILILHSKTNSYYLCVILHAVYVFLVQVWVIGYSTYSACTGNN